MLERLLDALAQQGVFGRGYLARVARATGYKPGTLSPQFNGKDPLTDRVIQIVCDKFGINEEYVRESKLPVLKVAMSDEPGTTEPPQPGGAGQGGELLDPDERDLLEGFRRLSRPARRRILVNLDNELANLEPDKEKPEPSPEKQDSIGRAA